MQIEKYMTSIDNLQAEYRPKLAKAVQKIVGFEVNAVGEALKGAHFERWLDGFYPMRGVMRMTRFTQYAEEKLSPVADEYMLRVQGRAADLLDMRPDMDALDEFIKTYIHYYALRHGSSSRRQIFFVRRRAKKEAKSLRAEITAEEAMNAAVTERLGEWMDKRAGAIAEDEAVREAGAASRETWAKSGVTKLRWDARSDACPICRHMHGAIVGIEEPFLSDGQVIYAPYEKKE